jgi:hypothetical protein
MSTDDSVRFNVKNRNRVLYILRRISPELKVELSKTSNVIARHFLADTRGRAWTPREQAISAGGTIRSGLVPKVAWNAGTLIMSRSSSDPFKVGGILFGTEFGGRTGNWWRPHRGKTGYLIYPTLRSHGREYAERWTDAVDDVLDKAARQSEGAARG